MSEDSISQSNQNEHENDVKSHNHFYSPKTPRLTGKERYDVAKDIVENYGGKHEKYRKIQIGLEINKNKKYYSTDTLK